ncbi:glycine cleavage system protein GcvH [candidate division KSB1 bacterium]|nr:glycine cleavage system protein GcvH [candidate division KSB1 bacterium]RQW00421.1 MAG: glycine cleavage system protein GcvH [candidate division KSB1 bacterium]
MHIPKDLKYTQGHEWIAIDEEIATVGITDYAQGELGDLVFIELPDAGSTVSQGHSFGTVEAVKAVSDLFAPVSGEVVEINTMLSDSPEAVNKDPYGEGWMIKVKISNVDELENLLSADAYKELIG